MSRFEIVEDVQGRWRGQLIDHNGKLMAESEPFARAHDAARWASDLGHAAKTAAYTSIPQARVKRGDTTLAPDA